MRRWHSGALHAKLTCPWRRLRRGGRKILGITNRLRSVAVLAAVAAAHPPLDQTSAAAPIKIGFSMALTGATAGNGKAALLATQMWADCSKTFNRDQSLTARKICG